MGIKIAIVSIGNEILNGSIIDTNSNYLSKTLTSYGYEIDSIYAVGDNDDKLSEIFHFLSDDCDIVITTGGLGPTFDDITMESLAKASGMVLKLNRSVYFDIVKKVKSKNVKLKLSHLKQIYLPENCVVLRNDYGTAPGVVVKINKTYFISLPGVPSEMKPMFENYALKFILDTFPASVKYRYDLKLIGVAESDIDEFLSGIDTEDVDIILNAQEGELAVRLFSSDKSAIDMIVKHVEDKFTLKLYSKNDEKIEDVVDKLLIEKGLTLGIVEKFSGGYLTLLMSDKKSFIGSIVKRVEDEGDIPLINYADIVLYPGSLKGNDFVLNIYFRGELSQIYTRYMGNKNFMKRSASKRSLGHLYEFIKSLDFL